MVYHHQKPNRQRPRYSGQAFLPFIAGVIAGLILTALVFLQTKHPNDAPEETSVEQVNIAPQTDQVNLDTLLDEQNSPEPTFEFYEILPDQEVQVPSWNETEQAKLPEQETSTTPGVYVLQVGAYRELSAADQVKARLALLGINAEIQRVVINGQDVFHRVRAGPYSTPDKLKAAQSRLINHDLPFKLLKLTVDEPAN